MEMKKGKKRFKLFSIVICLLLSFFCAFSLVGCVPSYGAGGGSSGGSGGSGGSGSSGGSGGGGSSGGSGGSSGGSNTGGYGDPYAMEDINEGVMGIIGVYDVGGNETVFYDKYHDGLISFNDVANRQFTTIATYIYKTLNRVYGENELSVVEKERFDITGYGADNKSVLYSQVISNDTQKKIIGDLGVTLGNSDKGKLNYKNAINGGYQLIETATDNGDGTTTYTYNYGTTLVSGNAWKSASVGEPFNSLTPEISAISKIAKDLEYIYVTYKDLGEIDSEITLNSNETLINRYKGFASSSNYTLAEVGMNMDYAWHIAYYIAYHLIGEANMNRSMDSDAHNAVFNGNSIKEITHDNYLKFQNYKGYHLIINDMVDNLTKMSIGSNSMSFDETKLTYETTPFPSMFKERYIYYDNANEVSDAYNTDLLEHKVPESDGGYDYSEDGDDSSFDYVDSGTKYKLKRLVILPNITKQGIDEFLLGGFMLGMKSEEGEIGVSCKVTYYLGEDVIVESGIFSEGDNVSNNILSFDNEYVLSEDLVDVAFTRTDKVSNISTELRDAVKTSFNTETKVVEYENNDSLTFTIGNLKLYNPLTKYIQDHNGWTDNVVTIDFEYQNMGNTIPETYLMYFMLYEG